MLEDSRRRHNRNRFCCLTILSAGEMGLVVAELAERKVLESGVAEVGQPEPLYHRYLPSNPLL